MLSALSGDLISAKLNLMGLEFECVFLVEKPLYTVRAPTFLGIFFKSGALKSNIVLNVI